MAKGYRSSSPMGGNMNANMIKQAQKMQQDMMKMQTELEEKTYTATSGGGAVSATVSGKRELTAIEISPDVVDPEDTDMLADLIMAAVNEALRRAESSSNDAMSKLTGGLNLGGLL